MEIGQKPSFTGNSEKVKKVFKLIQHLSPTKATVFIQGESGTGKELIAETIHNTSPASNGPIVKVNCSALAPGVIESELFGHEKGAFTGATSQKKGRFELADGGTLFLDEIGDLPAHVQIKILRFLQESQFERVGGTKTLSVNVRIISATHKNLEKLVQKEKFRADLLYRLKVVTLSLPPLRERGGDLDEIVSHYLKKFSVLHNKDISAVSADAMEMLRKYHWPGNVRELINCIESALITTKKNFIDLESLPPTISNLKNSPSAGWQNTHQKMPFKVNRLSRNVPTNAFSPKSTMMTLFEIEKRAILNAFLKTGKNKVLAAKQLGIATSTLYRKLESYGIQCNAGQR
ncbi:MAG: sigma-54 interaction domain-containing protein [Nitrospinota bacterium]